MEVCVDSLASAVNAAEGGASRLELCSALSEGGLTPTVGMLQVVKSLISIPVFVMIRPRRGIDFLYSEEEVKVMETDIRSLKSAGADGFTFGALTTGRDVNEKVCRQLLSVASPFPCTFHRAFDRTVDPIRSMEDIIMLGFQKILTSGQEESANKGAKLIHKLVYLSTDRILVMPGAGINEQNLDFILRETGAKEFHGSFRTVVNYIDKMVGMHHCTIGESDSGLLVTDRQLVEKLVKISKDVWEQE